MEEGKINMKSESICQQFSSFLNIFFPPFRHELVATCYCCFHIN